jgi:hypothetical protein
LGIPLFFFTLLLLKQELGLFLPLAFFFELAFIFIWDFLYHYLDFGTLQDNDWLDFTLIVLDNSACN